METAKQDNVKKTILEEIRKRDEILRKTYDDLKKTENGNKSYMSVLEDYDHYYNSKREEKQKQINALQTISEYLDKLSPNMSGGQREMLKKDKMIILNELKKIRQEL